MGRGVSGLAFWRVGSCSEEIYTELQILLITSQKICCEIKSVKWVIAVVRDEVTSV